MQEEKDWTATGLALFGALLICGGSWLAYLCPTDGQTGAIVYPLYLIGGVMGIAAFSICRSYKARWYIWMVVIACAIVAIGSVIYAMLAVS